MIWLISWAVSGLRRRIQHPDSATYSPSSPDEIVPSAEEGRA
jgi:hypothetical protein